MENQAINKALLEGDINSPGVLPNLEHFRTLQFQFRQDFGLETLPKEPGVILIRGPRQYGKSTWLEQQIALTIKQFGKGSALYLNGDEIRNFEQLAEEIRVLVQLFSPTAVIKRLFIDEITAVTNWEKAIKRLVDAGELRQILVITTGSKATDLRRGVERLPGRKGRLARTEYIFTPIAYREFKKKCGRVFKKDSLYAYMLSCGSPIAANALATLGQLPDYVVTIAQDWVLGEFAASGRSRGQLLGVLQSLYRMAATPIGQSKLARESGLANNTVAQGYINLLADLMTVMPAFPYDPEKKIALFRKPCKYPFINLLVALSWHPQKPRTIKALKDFGNDLGPLLEWLVAQELYRRLCIANNKQLTEHLLFWQSKTHEIDFVLPDDKRFIEVKSGRCSPTEFLWFLEAFKKGQLMVINPQSFKTERIIGITMEDFLLSE